MDTPKVKRQNIKSEACCQAEGHSCLTQDYDFSMGLSRRPHGLSRDAVVPRCDSSRLLLKGVGHMVRVGVIVNAVGIFRIVVGGDAGAVNRKWLSAHMAHVAFVASSLDRAECLG